MKRVLFAVLLSTILTHPALAQDEAIGPPPAATLMKIHVAPVALTAGGHAKAIVKLELVAGWHVYANPPSGEYNIPVKISLSGSRGVTVGAPGYPAGSDLKLPTDEKPVRVYDGAFEIPLPLDAAAAAENGVHKLMGKLMFQACNDRICLPPVTVPFTVELTVRTGAVAGTAPADKSRAAAAPDSSRAPPETTVTAAPGAGFTTAPPDGGAPSGNPTTQRLQDALSRGGLWWFLALFLGGLLLNLTPCVFPMLGITVSIFGARRKEPLPKVLGHAVAYVMGICVMYSALGVIAALTGGLFGSALQNPLVNVGLGVLLIGLSLSMFGVYEIQAPGWVLDRIGGANTTSIAGIFLSGLAVGVIAAPCVGPFVVAVLALIAQKGNVGFGFTTMFMLSLGLGFPYLFLAAFSNLLTSLPRSGDWMEWVKKAFGVLLASLGLYYALIALAPRVAPWVTPAILILGGLYLGFMEKSANRHAGFRLFKRVAGTAAVVAGVLLSLGLVRAQNRALPFKPYNENAVQASLAAGHGVILDFSADWCVACHELELQTFPDPSVRAAAANFDAYQIDLTRFDSPEADQWRQRYHIAGLPTVVFLRPDGKEALNARVEGFLPPAEFVKRLERAK